MHLAPAPATTPREPSAPRTPIVLPATPRQGLGPHHTFAVWTSSPRYGPTRHVMEAVRWWGRIPDADAFGVGRYMTAYLSQTLHEVLRGGADRLWEAAVASGADPHHLAATRDRFRTVARAGADPMVLLALRGSRLSARQRLLVARSGLTPAEAHDLLSRRALDLTAAATLAALRHTA